MIAKDDGWKIKIELDSINCIDDGYPGYYLNDGLPFIPRIGDGLYLDQSILGELDNHNPCPKCIHKEEVLSMTHLWEVVQPLSRLFILLAKDSLSVLN